MSALKTLGVSVALASAFVVATNSTAQAGRQYYSGWSYYQPSGYYYRHYYYRPTPTYPSYQQHYCIHYPARPRYVYYYNPGRQVYWGRYDLEQKGYSLLEEKDRKKNLDDIPEGAFPKPGQMPAIPDSEDGARIDAPPNDLPQGAPPKDLPVDKK